MDQSAHLSSNHDEPMNSAQQQQQPDSSLDESESNLPQRYAGNRYNVNNGENNSNKHYRHRNRHPNSSTTNTQNRSRNPNHHYYRGNNHFRDNSNNFHQRPSRPNNNDSDSNNTSNNSNNFKNDELPPRLQRRNRSNKPPPPPPNHQEQSIDDVDSGPSNSNDPTANQGDWCALLDQMSLNQPHPDDRPNYDYKDMNFAARNSSQSSSNHDTNHHYYYKNHNMASSNHRHHNFKNNRNQQSKLNVHMGGGKSRKTDKNSQSESQREIMDELLRKAQYDCIVCCDHVRIHDRTWNCSKCCNVFHLKCIQQWARKSSVNPNESQSSSSSNALVDLNSNLNFPSNESNNRNNQNYRNQAEKSNKNSSEWRCPTCQSVQRTFPNFYYCFCGKVKEPEVSNYRVPHSCGETCSKELNLFNIKLENEDYFECKHRCTFMCHPGKCKPCTLKVERICVCRKTKVYLNCSSKLSDINCPETCNKLLDCKNHRCQRTCHFGECEPCQEVADMKCFCGKETKESIPCKDVQPGYSCGQKCSKPFDCGNHNCEKNCHPGDCEPKCPYDPQTVTRCPCGKTSLQEMGDIKPRVTCLDPIPNCFSICGKQLLCGHQCGSFCHGGDCPPCDGSTIVRCYCGANSQKVDCKDLVEKNFRCKRKCNKRLSCGRHKCLKECCTEKEHVCSQVCGRKLVCGQHNCAEQCHPVCGSCPNVIWTEVYCNCRSECLPPPLPCGTPKPPCSKPCSRDHGCDHPPNHACHDDPECPPCVEFVSRRCHGGHEVRNSIPCYEKVVSCGRFCQKPLPCGLHKCSKVCHEGDCPNCTQKCAFVRPDCLHLCGLQCHQNVSKACPESPCLTKIEITCECEFHSREVECNEVFEPRKFQQHLDDLIRRYSFNSSISLDEMKDMVRHSLLHSLPCDAECARDKRNKSFAEALGIDPDAPAATANLVVKYSDQLKNEARNNPTFIMNLHDKFVQLINAFQQSNQKIMCYNFTPMNRSSREIVHAYAEHFGLKTESVDKEPNRSVMITATKMSQIPRTSLLESVNIDVRELRPKLNVVKYKTASEESKNKKIINHFDD